VADLIAAAAAAAAMGDDEEEEDVSHAVLLTVDPRRRWLKTAQLI
jgi:hypothetical protein